jgi:glycosyltransferase involved in cell wall biosynthesis
VSNYDSIKDSPHRDKIEAICLQYHPVHWKEPKKYSLRFNLALLKRSLSAYPISVIGDYSRAIDAKLRDLTAQQHFDLLICDFLQPSLNFRGIRGIPTLLFQHNVEHVILRRYCDSAANRIMRFFWWLQWLKMERYEGLACRRFNTVITVSETDKTILEKKYAINNVYSVPTGIDTDYYVPGKEAVEPESLIFTGSLDWLPNEDAIFYFSREILGKIKEQFPKVTLAIVGRNPSKRLLTALKTYPEIRVFASVPDIRPYVYPHGVYIVPLRIGGGTRIKIYEAMAMGKAVVSTTIGAEGLPVTHRENILLADQPMEFAATVIDLLGNKDKREALGRAAREFVVRNSSWQRSAECFAEICRGTVH